MHAGYWKKTIYNIVIALKETSVEIILFLKHD